jgi:hypothetical protein
MYIFNAISQRFQGIEFQILTSTSPFLVLKKHILQTLDFETQVVNLRTKLIGYMIGLARAEW